MARSRRTSHSPFALKVKAVVEAIPRGKVLAYGEVALLAGRPGGARAVVRALHQFEEAPWWRVVRSDRTLAVEMAAEQAPLLRAEGVRVEGRRVLVADEASSKPRLKRGAPRGPSGRAGAGPSRRRPRPR